MVRGEQQDGINDPSTGQKDLQKSNEGQIDEYDDEEEENEDDSSEKGGSPERLVEEDIKIEQGKTGYNKIRGVIPKDIENKKEMLSFIAYPPHIENTCKLVSQNKMCSYSQDGHHDKNRIFVSGTSIMSTKLHVGKEHATKLCDQLRN